MIFNFRSVHDQKINVYSLPCPTRWISHCMTTWGIQFPIFYFLISYRMFFPCCTGKYFYGRGAFGSCFFFLLSGFKIAFLAINPLPNFTPHVFVIFPLFPRIFFFRLRKEFPQIRTVNPPLRRVKFCVFY